MQINALPHCVALTFCLLKGQDEKNTGLINVSRCVAVT